MNLNQTFSILFWLNKSKTNKEGLVPIWVRITIDGRRAECSVKKQILLGHWDAENCKANKSCPEASSINQHLVLVQAEITKKYNVLISSVESVSAEDVKNSFKGIKKDKKTFLEIFEQYLQNLLEKKEVGEISEGRCTRFEILKGKCVSFIKEKLKKHDVLLEDAKLSFVTEFEHYLRTSQKIGHNTAMKYAKDLKQVMKYAVTLEYIPTNHFANFKCSYKKVKREYLDQTELDLMYNKELSIQRLAEVRDCYIFSCYTGYAYGDAEELCPDDVAIGIDGNKWIIRDRKKTDTTENIPLLPIPLEIVERYKSHPYCKAHNRLLPMNSNQRYNDYMKEIADLCGIKKKLTTHTARHTFATTVLLTNDVPIETAMELLGHTDIRTTQIYGKIVQKKISKDMNNLKNELSKRKELEVAKEVTI